MLWFISVSVRRFSAASVTSIDLPVAPSGSYFCRDKDVAICRTSSIVSGAKTIISSIRLRNSGEKRCSAAFITSLLTARRSVRSSSRILKALKCLEAVGAQV